MTALVVPSSLCLGFIIDCFIANGFVAQPGIPMCFSALVWFWALRLPWSIWFVSLVCLLSLCVSALLDPMLGLQAGLGGLLLLLGEKAAPRFRSVTVVQGTVFAVIVLILIDLIRQALIWLIYDVDFSVLWIHTLVWLGIWNCLLLLFGPKARHARLHRFE